MEYYYKLKQLSYYYDRYKDLKIKEELEFVKKNAPKPKILQKDEDGTYFQFEKMLIKLKEGKMELGIGLNEKLNLDEQKYFKENYEEIRKAVMELG